MRTLLLELRPAALVEANLGDLLRQLAQSVSGRSGIPVAVTLEGCPIPELPENIHVALYRIAQEALNNVVKHARAQRVEVRLQCLQDTMYETAVVRRVVLTVSDDGRGFDPSTVSSDHLGLSIIRERSQAIGAALRIASQPGQGTTVEIAWEPSPEG